MIRTIIVVNGILSTKADANADTHNINKMAIVSLFSSFTERIIYSVWFPIHLINPNLDVV